MKKEQPVIIIKKKVQGHGGHHGGAWKVAYADFVTAMMAFFLVMWLVSQKQEVKAAIGGYFRDPGAFDTFAGQGILMGGTAGIQENGAASVSNPAEMKAEQERARLSEAADRIRDVLEEQKEFEALKDQIEVTITAEGLQIELVDRSGSSFFDSGSAVLRGESVRILSMIAAEIGKLDNDVFLSGHTDSQKFDDDKQYGNWELSVDRANAARRVMMREGLRAVQLKGVRGLADTELHNPDDPADPMNRRVTILVRSKVAEAREALAKQENAAREAGKANAGGSRTESKPAVAPASR